LALLRLVFIIIDCFQEASTQFSLWTRSNGSELPSGGIWTAESQSGGGFGRYEIGWVNGNLCRL